MMHKYYITVGNKQVIYLADNPTYAAALAYYRFFDGVITVNEAAKNYKSIIGAFFRVSESGFTPKDNDILVDTAQLITLIQTGIMPERLRYENQ